MDRRSLGLTLIIIGLLLMLAGCGLKGARLVASVSSLQQRLRALGDVIQADQDAPRSAEVFLDSVVGLRQDVEGLKSEVMPWLAVGPLLGWLPGIGGDVQAAPQLLTTASAAADGAMLLALAVASVDSPDSEASAANNTLTSGLQQLSEAGPTLLAARARLAVALEARHKIDVGQLSARTVDVLSQVDRYLPLLQATTDAALLGARMLEAGADRRYLILLQNNDELRATGGFISGVAVLTIAQEGKVNLSIMDSYQVDDLTRLYPPPPDPLRDFMAADLWLFRDANWSPDFPTAAQTAAALFAWGQGSEGVDGVIAVDQLAARHILEAIGPVAIPGQAGAVSADNLVAFMYQAWSPQTGQPATHDWWEHRKDFLKDLAGAILARLQEPDALDVSRLFRELHRALNERHLLIYMRDALAAQILAENGWDGALRVGSGDYLMVVDTNMGFNKVNPNIRQSIAYRVNLADAARPTAEITISYRNESLPNEITCRQAPRYGNSYQDLMHRCYWDYLRILTPHGSQLLAGTPAPLPEGSLLRTFRGRQGELDTLGTVPDDGPATTFVSFFVLAPGESVSRQLSYLLPSSVVTWDGMQHVYRLFVQKQPGTLALPCKVEVVLPPGSEVVLSQPGPTHSEGNELVYELVLQTDQYLELEYR